MREENENLSGIFRLLKWFLVSRFHFSLQLTISLKLLDEKENLRTRVRLIYSAINSIAHNSHRLQTYLCNLVGIRTIKCDIYTSNWQQNIMKSFKSVMEHLWRFNDRTLAFDVQCKCEIRECWKVEGKVEK